MRKKAWVLMWWDAFGIPQTSDPFSDKGEAEHALVNMHITQEARILMIYINNDRAEWVTTNTIEEITA